MRITPKDENQLADNGLWPRGEYSFRVLDNAEVFGRIKSTRDQISEQGNEMIVLVLEVRNSRGNFKIIEDYLVESMAFKLRHACDACGILDKYNAGSFSAADFFGKSGKLTFGIKKDKDGFYPDKNIVEDYIKATVDMSAPIAAASMAPVGKDFINKDFINDDIPF